MLQGHSLAPPRLSRKGQFSSAFLAQPSAGRRCFRWVHLSGSFGGWRPCPLPNAAAAAAHNASEEVKSGGEAEGDPGPSRSSPAMLLFTKGNREPSRRWWEASGAAPQGTQDSSLEGFGSPALTAHQWQRHGRRLWKKRYSNWPALPAPSPALEPGSWQRPGSSPRPTFLPQAPPQRVTGRHLPGLSDLLSWIRGVGLPPALLQLLLFPPVMGSKKGSCHDVPTGRLQETPPALGSLGSKGKFLGGAAWQPFWDPF